jgi:hypothetical protein
MKQQRTVVVRARGVWALEGTSLLASLLVSCLPRQDLSSYSSGRKSSEPQSAPPDGIAAGDADAVLGESMSSSVLPQGASGSAATPSGCGAECLPMDLGLGADAGAAALGSPGATSSNGSMDAGSSARCAPDATPGPDERCFTLVNTVSSWQDARSGCQSRGAGWDLVTIHSTQRNAWLSALLGSVTDAWVGASDLQTEGAWRWVGDGTPFWNGSGAMGSPVGNAYVNWSPGSNPEPNGGDASDCLRLRSGGSWADYQCNSPFASICEGPSL